ncbi:hypothetical protein ABLO27_15605 [Roseibium sp. SCPC15]|uniref:alcohol dehydrogenase catalytic domain-containing protein n=1 Tax=Roseibium sp. SCP15 TaxID=3141376 RepID=UPI00333529FE
MLSLRVTSFSQDYGGVELQQVPDPEPKPGEVLIEVEAGGAFPADDLLLSNSYIIEPTLPFSAGRLGVGRVVASGGGVMGWLLTGKRVFFGTQPDRGGSWSEKSVAAAEFCIPVGDLPLAKALQVGNALTAVSLLRHVRHSNAKAIVMNAAASSLGRLVNTAARMRNLPVLNIVRSDEQIDALVAMKVGHILDQRDVGYEDQLRDLCHRLSATLAIDSVGGQMTGILLDAMPEHSKVTNVGNLSGETVELDVLRQITGRRQALEGFEIAGWLSAQTLTRKLSIVSEARKLAANAQTDDEIRQKVPLKDAAGNLENLFSGTTSGVAAITVDPTGSR